MIKTPKMMAKRVIHLTGFLNTMNQKRIGCVTSTARKREILVEEAGGYLA